MVHSTEASSHVAWMTRLGGKLSASMSPTSSPKKNLNASWDLTSNSGSDVRLGSFDYADVLERGMGPGLASNFVDPPRETGSKGELRFQVVVEKKTSSIFLMIESGQKCLEACPVADGFDIFAAREGESPKLQEPLFVLRTDGQKAHWRLCSLRCEQCVARGKRQCGTRELARLMHYQEAAGDGHAFCMDVELPAISEAGNPEVICEVCSDPDARLGHTVLTTRRPKWNATRKTLTLDFRGRCSLASAKNFQLEIEGKPEPGKSRLLFGKCAADTYVLDVQRPLGPVQAFAAAISAMHWK